MKVIRLSVFTVCVAFLGLCAASACVAQTRAVVDGRGFSVLVEQGGALRVMKNGEVYTIESTFSYPGESIGINSLAEQPGQKQSSQWKPSVRQSGAGQAVISASCAAYALERTVAAKGDKLSIFDKVTNTSGEPVGILIRHSVKTHLPFKRCLFAGVEKKVMNQATDYDHSVGDHPTMYIEMQNGSLGTLVEDNALRRHFSAESEINRASFKAEHFGLGPGKNYTFEWTVYPFGKETDYWGFVNRIRRDWKIDFPIHGPVDFFHVQRSAKLLDDPVALKAYLKRKHMKVVMLSPWLDYDNFSEVTHEQVTRAEYKEMMQKAAKALRQADPNIWLVGCIEVFPVQLSLRDSKAVYSRLSAEDQSKQGYPLVTREMLSGLESIDSRRLDCVITNPDGRYTMELYFRGYPPNPVNPKGPSDYPMAALSAYPAPGNAQQEYLLEQCRFVLKEVGLDGVYMDSFNLAWGYDRLTYDYSKWDGTTVDIDPQTGRISRKYTDAGLVGGPARAELIKYVLKNGKVMIGNTYAITREEQSLPCLRFSESEYQFDALKIGKGEMPPYFSTMSGAQLTTPIGLGYRPARLENGPENYAHIVMKTAITYLRHGGLAYFYATEIPETGPVSGEYGPYNHMYPITPVELHEGYIIGKERVITAISGTYPWNHKAKPNVLVFDINGRPTTGEIDIQPAKGGWNVKLGVEDWENIAVLE